MTYFGYYNEIGYWISQSHNGHPLEIYRAGNHQLESTQVLPINDSMALPLKIIREFCIQTGAEMAKENGVRWGGVEYEEYNE